METYEHSAVKKFIRRAREFYNSAEILRKNFQLAVNVIDYCTALSFELILKSILVLRGKWKFGHDIIELFKLCDIKFDNEKYNELIEYYNVILNETGRYSTTKDYIDKMSGKENTNRIREKINKSTKNLFIKKENYFSSASNPIYEINPQSGIVDNSYKHIWQTINELAEKEYKKRTQGLP